MIDNLKAFAAVIVRRLGTACAVLGGLKAAGQLKGGTF